MFLVQGLSWASCPLWTYPENHKLDAEVNNICKSITNPIINFATISSGTAVNLTVTSETVKTRLTVPNGVAATDAAAFGQIVTSSITYTTWASYTPSIAGCGTVSAVSFFWKQIGDTIFVKGFWTTGAVSGSGVTISLPNSTVINTAKVAANFYLGKFDRLPTAASSAIGNGSVFTDGTVGNDNVVFCTQGSGANKFTAQGGSTIFLNGDSAAVFFDYPI